MENDALFKDIFKTGFIKSTENLLESFHQGYIDEEDYANLLEELVKTYKEFFSSRFW